MKPYWREQAERLLEDGHCHFPVTAEDVANRMLTQDSFGHAIHEACHGRPALLQMVRIRAAIELCKSYDLES